MTAQFWQRILEPYRSEDWHECIRLLRGIVDASPFETTPRQLLASLYRRVDQPRYAQLHYEKLLPLAVGHGDLFRAIAIQRRLDALDPHAAAEGRYAAMQRWFRLVGLPQSFQVAGELGPTAFLALPQTMFESVACGLEIRDIPTTPNVSIAPTGTAWVVLYGRIRWSMRREGKTTKPEESGEREIIIFDPLISTGTELAVEATLPAECLCFSAGAIAELGKVMPKLAAGAILTPEFISEHRSSPHLPRRYEDIDAPSAVPATPSLGPPRLDLGEVSAPRPGEGLGEWAAELGEIELSIDASAPELGIESEDEPREHLVDLDERRLGEPPRVRRGQPVVEAASSVELESGLIVPPIHDPFAPKGAIGTPIERRRTARVEVTCATRIVMAGIGGSRARPVIGQVFDLSPLGVAIRFLGPNVWRSLAGFESAAIRLQLVPPGGGSALELAGRVRSLEVSEARDEARVGVEFLLLTESDRKTLELLADRGPQAA